LREPATAYGTEGRQLLKCETCVFLEAFKSEASETMDGFILLTFAALAAITALLELFKRKEKSEITNREFTRFRSNYVFVFALMMGKTLSIADTWTASNLHRLLGSLAQSITTIDMTFLNPYVCGMQLVIGCKDPTCMHSTSTMVSIVET
jgi:hypothetical protein